MTDQWLPGPMDVLLEDGSAGDEHGVRRGVWGVSPDSLTPDYLPVTLTHLPSGLALAWFRHGSAAMRCGDVLQEKHPKEFSGELSPEALNAIYDSLCAIISANGGVIADGRANVDEQTC